MQPNDTKGLKCFVLMPFRPAFAKIYLDLYLQACHELGMACSRIDDEKYMKRGTVAVETRAEIAAADVVIADVSTNSPNVFYELGVADTINKHNVIITKQKSKTRLPFNIQHERAIIYSTGEDGLNKAKEAIKRTILNIHWRKTSSEQCVRTFYNKLRVHDYRRAWDCISPTLQVNRWRSDVQIFIDGYKDTVSLSHIHVSPFSDETDVMRYHVSYIEEVNSPRIDELAEFGRRTFSQLENMINDRERIKGAVGNKGYDPAVIDDLTMFQLTSPNRGAVIEWLLSKGGGSNDNSLFRVKNMVRCHNCVEVTLTRHDEDWLISKFRPVNT